MESIMDAVLDQMRSKIADYVDTLFEEAKASMRSQFAAKSEQLKGSSLTEERDDCEHDAASSSSAVMIGTSATAQTNSTKTGSASSSPSPSRKCSRREGCSLYQELGGGLSKDQIVQMCNDLDQKEPRLSEHVKTVHRWGKMVEARYLRNREKRRAAEGRNKMLSQRLEEISRNNGLPKNSLLSTELQVTPTSVQVTHTVPMVPSERVQQDFRRQPSQEQPTLPARIRDELDGNMQIAEYLAYDNLTHQVQQTSFATIYGTGGPIPEEVDSTMALIKSSQSTDEGDIPSPALRRKRQDPSQDDCEILLLQPSKRRRHQVQPDGPHQLAKVKREPSSPVIYPARAEEESFDLDEVNGDYTTPRKRNRYRNSLKEAPIPTLQSSTTRSSSEPPAPKQNSHVRIATSFQSFELQGESVIQHRQAKPLQQLNVNTPRAGKSNQTLAHKDGRLGEFTEDGDVYEPVPSSKVDIKTPKPTNEKSAAAPRRLEALLAAPSPVHTPITALRVERLPPGPSSQRTPLTHTKPPGKEGSNVNISVAQKPAAQTTTAQPATAQETNPRGPMHVRTPLSASNRLQRKHVSAEPPLRSRPPEQLGLADFRINPAVNSGVDFAHFEVVRGGGRRCLPGCTREECCGQYFRRMAEIGGVSARPRRLLEHSQDDPNETDEDRLLKAYMGSKAHLISTMSPSTRKQHLSRAQTEHLSNQYGRHRNTWPREPSPTGAWRTDFPSTQEQEADRLKIERRVQEEIAERHRQACRPGGRWIFADGS